MSKQQNDADHSAIRCQNICIRYGEKPVLENFELHVEKGDFLALTGPSGSGKSSILRVIMGFQQPEAGWVSVFGKRVSAENAARLRGSMAWQPQLPSMGNSRVLDWLLRPFEFERNQPLKPEPARIHELMVALLLPHKLLQQSMQQLSGGEQQRMILLLCVLLQRDILLLDEPTASLDERAKESVAKLLSGLTGTTILAATHDHWFGRQCHRVIPLAGGENSGSTTQQHSS